jgi:hypothetical protein
VDDALITALEPVLRDVHRSDVGVYLRVDDAVTEDEGLARAILWAQDGSGTGIQVDLGDSAADQIAELANVVQDIVVKDFLLTPWPQCPLPFLGHPLLASAEQDSAVWTCPTTKSTIAKVGTLPK